MSSTIERFYMPTIHVLQYNGQFYLKDDGGTNGKNKIQPNSFYGYNIGCTNCGGIIHRCANGECTDPVKNNPGIYEVNFQKTKYSNNGITAISCDNTFTNPKCKYNSDKNNDTLTSDKLNDSECCFPVLNNYNDIPKSMDDMKKYLPANSKIEIDSCNDLNKITILTDFYGTCTKKNDTQTGCINRTTQVCAEIDLIKTFKIGEHAYASLVKDNNLSKFDFSKNRCYESDLWSIDDNFIEDIKKYDISMCNHLILSKGKKHLINGRLPNVFNPSNNTIDWKNATIDDNTYNLDKLTGNLNYIKYQPSYLKNPTDQNSLINIFDNNLNILVDEKNILSTNLINYVSSFSGTELKDFPNNIKFINIKQQFYMVLATYIFTVIFTFMNDFYNLSNKTSELNFTNTAQDYLGKIMSNKYLNNNFTSTNLYQLLINNKNFDTYQSKTLYNNLWNEKEGIFQKLMKKPILNFDYKTLKYTITFTLSNYILQQNGINCVELDTTIATPTFKFNCDNQLDTYSKLESLANKLLQNIIRDNETIIKYFGRTIDTIANVKIQNNSLNMYILDFNNPETLSSSNISKIPFTKDKIFSFIFKNILFLTSEFTVEVTEWSPMLLIFFNDIFDKQLKDNKLDINLFNHLLDKNIPIPIQFEELLYDKTDNNKLINNYYNLCNLNIKLPSIINFIDVNNYLLGSNNKRCPCILNKLFPAKVPLEISKNAGMCFTNTCTSDDINFFKLTKNNCYEYCDYIQDLNRNEFPYKSAFPERISNTKILNICGEINNKENVSFNKNVLIFFLVLTFISIICVYLFSSSTNIKIIYNNKIFITIVISLLLISITGFLTFDLVGQFSCIPKSKTGIVDTVQQCKSKISNINIPIEFCELATNCECQWNNTNNSYQDKGECKCIQNYYISSKERIKSDVKIYKFSTLYLIFTIFLSILLVILTILLNKNFKVFEKIFNKFKINKFRKIIYFAILVIVFIIPPIVFLIDYFIPKKTIEEKPNC